MILSRRLLAAAASLLVAACADSGPGTPLAPDAALRSTAPALSLVDCPASADSTAGTYLGLLGGTLRVNGHHLDAPFGAIQSLLSFRAEVRSSRYLEVDFSALGYASFLFNSPVRITIDYSRCPAASITGKTLHILYIDPTTKAVLQDMGGTDDRQSRTITTTTDHLSDYALGAN